MTVKKGLHVRGHCTDYTPTKNTPNIFSGICKEAEAAASVLLLLLLVVVVVVVVAVVVVVVVVVVVIVENF